MANDAQEKAWIIAVRQGDFEAFERIFQLYQRRLYAFFFRLCWDAGIAEDLMQETFIRLWKSALSFDADKPLAPWLYRVGKNVWIDSERRGRKRTTGDTAANGRKDGSSPLDSGDFESAQEKAGGAPGTPRDVTTGSAGDMADPRDSSPQSRMERGEIEQAVKRALAKLDADKRLVVVLSFYQGLKLKEIADVLEIPVGTVKSRLFHAEQALRGSLQHLMNEV